MFRAVRPVLALQIFALSLAACASDVRGSAAEESDDGESGPTMRQSYPLFVTPPIDVLLVIDDSASMAEEQANLAANLQAFVNLLEDPEIWSDWRIAVIHTSGTGCGAPAGVPLIQSCRERLGDFLIPTGREAPQADLRSQCEQACAHEAITILPSSSPNDSAIKARPWLQRSMGNQWGPNVGVPAGEALECIGMTGVSGCDYESPVEAILSFLDRNDDPNSESFGFLRDNATFFTVIISDEDDCSLADASILDPNGSRVFWPADATGSRAPSATCFRAGSQCDLVGPDLNCVAVDRAADGAPTNSSTAAVLTSLETLDARLNEIADRKVENDLPRTSVQMGLLTGVDNAGRPNWPAVGDAGFLSEFGTAPGCEIGAVQGQSPPRLLELNERWGFDDAVSSCLSDYTPVFGPIGVGGGSQLRPSCFADCAADDDESPGLQPACSVRAFIDDQNFVMLECLRDDAGYMTSAENGAYLQPDGEEYCYLLLTDAENRTPDPHDDLASECVADGYNLQFQVSSRGTGPVHAAHYEVECLVDATVGACG